MTDIVKFVFDYAIPAQIVFMGVLVILSVNSGGLFITSLLFCIALAINFLIYHVRNTYCKTEQYDLLRLPDKVVKQ